MDRIHVEEFPERYAAGEFLLFEKNEIKKEKKSSSMRQASKSPKVVLLNVLLLCC